jgi:hypothetical protein
MIVDGRLRENLIRAGLPERIAMLRIGHEARAVFDRYNIGKDRELLTAGSAWQPTSKRSLNGQGPQCSAS